MDTQENTLGNFGKVYMKAFIKATNSNIIAQVQSSHTYYGPLFLIGFIVYICHLCKPDPNSIDNQYLKVQCTKMFK